MLTGVGPVEINPSGDVVGSFEPKIVKKRQRRLTDVEIVLSLMARGLATGEIAAHFHDVYETHAKDTITSGEVS